MKSIFALLAILIMAMAPMVLADDGTDHASEDGESEVQDNEVQKRGKGMGRANADTRLESRTARKQKMKAMREGLQSCAGQRTEECKTLRRQARTDAKEVLQHTVGRINDLLEIAKERIAASNMPEDQKAQLLAELNAKLADVVSTEEVSGELSPTSTTAQVKKAAKEVRKQAQESRRALRKAAHHLISGKLGGALKRAEQLEAKLERIVERMKASGVDVSILSDAFASKIVDARTAYDQSTQLFEQARAAEAGQKDELMKQATSELRESHKILKEAHVLLRDLVRTIKARGGSVDNGAADDGEADDGETDGEADDTDGEADVEADDTDSETDGEADDTSNSTVSDTSNSTVSDTSNSTVSDSGNSTA